MTARPGIERADAMLAILDGPSVDDGTACEIGMFRVLMQSDPPLCSTRSAWSRHEP